MSEQNTLLEAGEAPPMMMLKMISGFWISRAIYVAAKLGIADLVKDRAMTAAELAEATGTHAPSLYRVLRALASVRIFAKDDGGRFHLTPLAATLQSDAPGSLRYMAMTELGEEHYPAWELVLQSVKTGEIAFDRRFGMPIWEFFEKNPENASIFNNAMSNMTAGLEEALLASYDFSSIRKLVDVGGGHGGLITSILKANPSMRGVLFDAPSVVEGARQKISAAGLQERCELVGGDFFKSVSEGGDAYILKWIIHDWNDEQSVAILTNCRRAVAPGGKLLLVEAVIPPGDEPSFSKFIDLNMLVMTGGRERTEAEYRNLLQAAGFELTRIVPTPTPFSVIEGASA
ncbi:MAG TPA: methyltransferase [Blastocatellia bacterium]|nr:methyltransferase [Blastocatellia bacterium]